MKIKLAALALLISGALCCSDSFAHDPLLGRMLGRGGCGCDAAPTCCDTPAASCGGNSFSNNVRSRCGFLSGLRGRGVGCGSYADAGCGCDAPIGDCCDSGRGCRLGGRLRGLFNRGGNDGCCDTGYGNACDTGCSAAPVTASCGTDAGNACCGDPCGSSGGLLSGLTGRLRGGRGCGCGHGNAWGGDCGCSAAPVAAGCGCNGGGGNACGCGDAGGCGNGFLSGLRGRFGSRRGNNCGYGNDCGCSAAPVAAGCGCNGGAVVNDCCDPCGRGGRQGLLGRLRGGRGNGCCGAADNCCGGHVHAVAAGCGCNGGAAPVQAAPMEAAPAQGNGNGEVVAPPDAGTNRIKAPMVDPNSFIIRNTGYRN